MLAAVSYWRQDAGDEPPIEWRSRLAWGLALAGLAALGAWCEQVAGACPRFPDLSRFLTGQQAVVTAHVVRDGIRRPAGQGRSERELVDVETEEISAEGVTTPVSAGIRLTRFSGDSFFPSADKGLLYGERLRFPVKLREPRNYQNPGASDFRGALLRQGILATGSVREDDVERLPGFAGTRRESWCSRARRSVLKQIGILWPEAQVPLMDATLIGERALIGRETRSEWQRTGLYHILVVSGLKVGILAFAVFWLARRLGSGELPAALVAFLAAGAYGWLAEMGTPVMRAVIMLGVYLLARLLYRDRATLNVLGAAALLLLAFDPRALFEVSFQLTFFSMVMILGLAVPILERTSGRWRRVLRHPASPDYDVSLPPRWAQFRVELRMLAGRLAELAPLPAKLGNRWALAGLCLVVRCAFLLYETVVVSFVLQLALTLPMAIYFHQGTVVGAPANAVAVPLTGILIPAAALALVLSYGWLPLAKLPALAASWALSGIEWAARTFGAMKLGSLRLPTPDWLPAGAFLLTVVLAMLLVRRHPRLAGAGMAALTATALWLTIAPAHPQFTPGVLEITGIDVEQAESTLIVTPQGRTILVDAGGSLGNWTSDFDFGEEVVAPYLWSRGFSHLDAVAATYGHSEYIGGMRGVAACFHPRELWLGAGPEAPALSRLRRELQEQSAQVTVRGAGDRFDFGGAAFRILAPPHDGPAGQGPRNNDSLVLLVSYGRTSALLTGGAEKPAERELLAEQPRADLLKVAHHGSLTSTTPEFLSAVRPSWAMISVGAHNRFGHPRREVLERLAQARVATYRTDTAGAVTFFLNGNSVWLARHGGAPSGSVP